MPAAHATIHKKSARPAKQETGPVVGTPQAETATVDGGIGSCPCGGGCPRCVLGASRGRPLDASVRGVFETRFGRDLSSVRVHTDSVAGTFLHSAQANAAALGHDLFFAPGIYAPNRVEGRRLLAHELAHVVQQELPGGTSPSLDHEAEAGELASAFVTTNATLRPHRAATLSCQFDKPAAYPKTITIGNAAVKVASQAEETEANKIISDIKSVYGIDFDSTKGLQALKAKIKGDPDEPQTISQSLANEPRYKVKDLLHTSTWTLAQLRAVKHGLSYFSPVLGMARSTVSTRAASPQELTSLSRLNVGLNQTNDATQSSVQGEYFSSSNTAALFDSADSGTELADKTKAFEGTVVHEAAHALLGYGKSDFINNLSPRYWQDADTPTNDPKAEKPVTNYGTKNAGEDLADAAMFYFMERATLQGKCPQRAAILDRLVKGWSGPPGPKP